MKWQIHALTYLFILLYSQVAVAQTISVSGYVFDTNGNPINLAKVLLVPNDPNINPVAVDTNGQGYYTAQIARGAEIDVLYGSKGTQVAVRRLDGRRDQSISKILAPSSGNAQYVFDFLQSIEYVGFYSQTNERLVATMRQNEVLPAFAFVSEAVFKLRGDNRQRDLVMSKFKWMDEHGLMDFLKPRF